MTGIVIALVELIIICGMSTRFRSLAENKTGDVKR